METRFNVVIIITAICVTAYAAIAFGCITIYKLGLSGDLVLCIPMLAAILIAAMLAIDYFGKGRAQSGGTLITQFVFPPTA
jgi:hypothetical protein